MKKLITIIIVSMLAFGFNVLPAEAYSVLQHGDPPQDALVTITASGTLAGNVATFGVQAVNQITGSNPSSAVAFTSPSGNTNSGRALKIDGGTNYLDARIIVYTDNGSYFPTPKDYKLDPSIGKDDNPTGIDGGGMVGATESVYTTALYWGVFSAADGDPNENDDGNTPAGGYAFTYDADHHPTNANYIVDTRHDFSFVDEGNLPPLPDSWGANNAAKADTLDDTPLYDSSGNVPTDPNFTQNIADDGLYPQLWKVDLYGHEDPANPSSPLVLISEALYKNIATVAFSLGDDGTNYVCTVGKLPVVAPPNNTVSAKLALVAGATGTAESLYIHIGGNFVGKPAQEYRTEYLRIAMIQD